MEAFLSTLPPYVHVFLGKHPPTDVFNLLKELVCFAVLYSDDRARIQSTTEALIKKKEAEEEKEEEEALVPEIHTIEPIKEEIEPETKEVVAKAAKPTYNIRTGELIQTDKSTMPNTFPQWWGDEGGKTIPNTTSIPNTASKQKQFPAWWGDAEDNNSPETTLKQNNYDKNKPYGRWQEDEFEKKNHHGDIVKAVPAQQEAKTEAYGSSWITWDDTPANSNPHRFERARSQIIPNLRSYPSEDNARITSSQTSPAISANLKRHSTINLKSSISPPARATNTPRINSTITKNPRRLSAPVCESPTTTTQPATQSKFALTAAKQQRTSEADTASNASSETASSTRSVSISKPRPNAAMRARAEHARQQKLELDQKKKTPNTPVTSSHSLRLKERVNSGIDWETIKKDRRNTIAEESATKKK